MAPRGTDLQPGAEAVSSSGFTHREILSVLWGVLLGMMMAALDSTIVTTALPRIATDLDGFLHLSWVVTAYLLTSTVAAPIYGKLSDLYGRRRLLQFAITVFVIASVVLRPGAEHGHADRVACVAGYRWRRVVQPWPGGDRRCRLGTRARPLSGLHHRHLGPGLDRWAARRRAVHRLSHAGAGRSGSICRSVSSLSSLVDWALKRIPVKQRAPLDRFPRRRADDAGGHRVDAGLRLGRHDLSVDVADDPRPCRRRALLPYRFRTARAARARGTACRRGC